MLFGIFGVMYFNFKAKKNSFALIYYSSVKYIFFYLFLMFFVNHTYTMHRQFNVAIWFQQAYTSPLPKSMRLLLDQKRRFTNPLSPRKKNYEKNILQEIYNTLFLNIAKSVAFDLTNNNIAKPDSQANKTPIAPPSAKNEELDTKNSAPHKSNDKDEKGEVKSTQKEEGDQSDINDPDTLNIKDNNQNEARNTEQTLEQVNDAPGSINSSQQDTVPLANESNNQDVANKTPLPATSIVPLNEQIIPTMLDKDAPILYPRILRCVMPLCIFLKEKYKLPDYMYNVIKSLNLRPIYSVILCQWYHTMLASETEIRYHNRNEELKLPVELLYKIFCFMSNNPHETKAKQDFTDYYLDETSGEALSNAYVEIPGKCTIKRQGRHLIITPTERPANLETYTKDVLDCLTKYKYIPNTTRFRATKWDNSTIKDKTDLSYLVSIPVDPDDPRSFPLHPVLESFYHSGRLTSQYPHFENNIISEALQQRNEPQTALSSEDVKSNITNPEQNKSSCVLRSQCIGHDTLTVKEFFTDEYIIGGGDCDCETHPRTKPPAKGHVVQVTNGTKLIKEIVLPVFTEDETRYDLSAPFQLARYNLVGIYPHLSIENHDNSIIIFYDTKTGKYPCVPLMSDCFNANNISQETFFYHQDNYITTETKGIRSMLFDYNRDIFLKKQYKPKHEYPPRVYFPNNSTYDSSVFNFLAQGTRQLQSALKTVYDALRP